LIDISLSASATRAEDPALASILSNDNLMPYTSLDLSDEMPIQSISAERLWTIVVAITRIKEQRTIATTARMMIYFLIDLTTDDISSSHKLENFAEKIAAQTQSFALTSATIS
jgi:hypothetical protein